MQRQVLWRLCWQVVGGANSVLSWAFGFCDTTHGFSESEPSRTSDTAEDIAALTFNFHILCVRLEL